MDTNGGTNDEVPRLLRKKERPIKRWMSTKISKNQNGRLE